MHHSFNLKYYTRVYFEIRAFFINFKVEIETAIHIQNENNE